MSDQDFVEIINDLRPIFNKYFNESRAVFPTTFTINTVIALAYFAKKKVDYAVVEVSVGGERDSTNAIPHKELALITNIGIDHTGVLGNTKVEIAKNKAGIIKPKSIVVTSERDEKLIKIIKNVAQKRRVSDFTVLDSDRYSKSNKDIIKCDWNGIDFIFEGDKYHINNFGHHQITNAELVITASKKIGISKDAIKKGIAATEFPIRLEVVSQKPYIVIDGAHNSDKIKSTILGIASIKNKYKNLHLLIGFSDNKDYKKFIKELVSLKPVSISCTRFTKNLFRRPADPKKLVKLIKNINPKIDAESFLEPEFALEWSRKKLKKDDLLLITGSMFLSGELRPRFKKIK